jgi:ankyrin repeat protein
MTDLASIKPLRVDLAYSEQMQLFAAVSNNDLRHARALLESGVSALSADMDDDTPLIMAAAAGRREMMQLLLDHGADVNQPGLNGRSALRAAIEAEDAGTVTFLLTAGADPLMTSYDPVRKEDINDVMAAAKAKNTEIVFAVSGAASAFHMIETVKGGTEWKAREWALRDDCDVNAYNRNGLTGLIHACQMGRLDLVEMLWHAGADPAKPCKYDPAITPLSMAEESGNPHVMRLIRRYLEQAEQEFRHDTTHLQDKVTAMKPIRFKPKM